MSDNTDWDFFISHASEDKEEVAKPLAEFLQGLGFKVWYDDFSLKLGDNLYQTISKGLSTSKKGIVILSNSFIAKNWPKQELDGLMAQEMATGETRIFPIRHNITNQELVIHFPMLANRKNISSSEGLEQVVREIIRAVEGSFPLPDLLPSPAHDILLPQNIIDAFKKIVEFKQREFDGEEITNLWQTLLIFGIRTRNGLDELVTSVKLLNILRKLCEEELLRPTGNTLEPFEVALFGSYLLKHGTSTLDIEYVRKMLRKTDEYRKKHPDANIPPSIMFKMPKITNGKTLADLISSSDAYRFNNDDPENDEEAQLLTDFLTDIDEADIGLSEPSLKVWTTRRLDDEVKALEDCGLYVYAVLRKGKLTTKIGVVENYKQLEISVLRRNLDSLIGLIEPDAN
jgi:hypothetical protein